MGAWLVIIKLIVCKYNTGIEAIRPYLKYFALNPSWKARKKRGTTGMAKRMIST